MEAATHEGVPPVEGAPKAGFEIEGQHYEIPTLDTFNLDEERIIYVYADVVLQDFADVDPRLDETEKALIQWQQLRNIRNPDFKRAIAHVAYRRKHPDVSDAEINAAMGLVNAHKLDLAMVRAEDEADPTKGFQMSSLSVSDGNGNSDETSTPSESMTTGSGSENGSEKVVVLHSTTGTSELDTSSESSPETVVSDS